MDKSTKITIYYTPACGKCKRAKELLLQKNIAFNEVDLTDKPELVEALSKEGFYTVPIIKIERSFADFDQTQLEEQITKLQ